MKTLKGAIPTYDKPFKSVWGSVPTPEPASPVFSPAQKLHGYAIQDGFGYKTANLMLLQEQAKSLSSHLHSCKVKVPSFAGVCHQDVQAFLEKHFPELQALWTDFQQNFPADLVQVFINAENEIEASKVPLKITKEGLSKLALIEKKIEECFQQQQFSSAAITKLTQKKELGFLIVRSTGKEDSEHNANAGGNKSIPFVQASPAAISQAIGEVVASYFSAKSIRQRLLSGDRSLFIEPPFMPMLIQKMAAVDADSIARSGVFFTEQKDKAEGVTFIQTGLGNNEGIVSGQAAVDSYFIGTDHKLHTVVQRKPIHFGAVAHGLNAYKVEAIKTDSVRLEKSQALPNPVIHDLKRVADRLSATYAKKALDVEYTISLADEKPVIYLLQARPLQSGAHAEQSFLDLDELKKVKPSEKASVSCLLDGNACVKSIVDEDEVLMASDLHEAYVKFCAHAQPESIKAIIMRKTAPSTAHEAVFLKPKGIPILITQDAQQFDKIEKLIAQATAEKPFLIDTQRGVVAMASTEIIRNGLISYPIPLEYSLPLPPWILAASTLQTVTGQQAKATAALEIKTQLAQLHADYKTLMHKLTNGQPLLDGDDESLRTHFDHLAMQDAPQAKQSLAIILHHLHCRLLKNVNETESFRAFINMPLLQAYYAAIKLASEEVLPALENCPPQSLNRLYSVKFLDAAVFQKASEKIVGGFSYASVLTADKQEKEAVAIAKKERVELGSKNGLLILRLLQAGEAAYSSATQEAWHSFVAEVCEQGLEDRLEKIVSHVAKLKLTPSWLNIIFNQANDEDRDVLEIIEELEQIQQENSEVLQFVAGKMQLLKQMEQQIAFWAQPDYVEKHAVPYTEKLLRDFAIGNHFAKASTFGKIALLQLHQQVTSVYDQTIKAVTASSDYPADRQQQAKHFAMMLKGYFTLMQTSLALLSKEDERKLMTLDEWMGVSFSFDEYISELKNGAEYQFNTNFYESEGFDSLYQAAMQETAEANSQFQARREFNVEAMTIGSQVDLHFSAHWPANLEEYFTTFHQNIEKVNRLLMKQNGLNKTCLKNSVRMMCKAIRKTFKQDLADIAIEEGMIKTTFQIPLRQHAGKITLTYNQRKPKSGFDLQVDLFGANEHDRWEQAATFAAVLGHWHDVSYANGERPCIHNTSNGSRGVSFSLHFPEQYKQKKVFVELLEIIMKDLTSESIGGPTRLVEFMEEQCESIQELDWELLPDSFFQDGLYVATDLLNAYAYSSEMTNKIAKNSLLGLAKEGKSDFQSRKRPPKLESLESYLGCKEYDYVPGNTAKSRKLALAATLHLIKNLEEDYEAAFPVIEELVNNKAMHKYMPDTVAALHHTLMEMSR